MERRGEFGHIINVSSMSGHRVPDGASGGAFYSATKFALRALTEGLRQEVSWQRMVPYYRHPGRQHVLLPQKLSASGTVRLQCQQRALL